MLTMKARQFGKTLDTLDGLVDHALNNPDTFIYVVSHSMSWNRRVVRPELIEKTDDVKLFRRWDSNQIELLNGVKIIFVDRLAIPAISSSNAILRLP